MSKNLLYLLIFTTFVVILWIILNIYHNRTESTISRSLSTKIAPINTNFDEKTLNSLNSRKKIPVDLKEKIEFPSSLITVPTSSPKSSESANLNIKVNETQTATGSGIQ